MTPRGKLIALEGIDGSGKRTQLDLLARALEARGAEVTRISFPRYDSFFGKLVARYLNGEFGPLEAVDPRFSALLYAGDRHEAKPELESALAAGRAVLADRYIASNLAHQAARMPREHRAEFLAWLRQLEYGVYALPAEDLVIYLHLPAAEAHRLIGLKSQREYTSLRRDLHEADVRHLEQAALVYDELAAGANWVRIECCAASGALRSPEEIFHDVLQAVDARIFSRAPLESGRSSARP